MNVIETHKKVWDYLVSHQDLLLKKWDWVRFDQNIVLSEGKFSDPPPPMYSKPSPSYRCHITIWQHPLNPWGGNTTYTGTIRCETWGIESSLAVEYPSADEPDYDPMRLNSHTIHENTHSNIAKHGSPMLSPEIAAKEAVDVLMEWLDIQLGKSNDQTTSD